MLTLSTQSISVDAGPAVPNLAECCRSECLLYFPLCKGVPSAADSYSLTTLPFTAIPATATLPFALPAFLDSEAIVTNLRRDTLHERRHRDLLQESKDDVYR